MTGQSETFQKWQHLLRQAYDSDASQTRCPNLYDILNSPKVEQLLKRDKKDCPPLMVGKIDRTVLDQRWDIAYHKILGSSFWQNHEEATFAGEIQTVLNDGKEILADPVREDVYRRSLGLAAPPPTSPAPTPQTKAPPPPPPPDHSVYINQGIGLIKSGDYRAAIEQFNQAIRLQPTSCEAFASRAWAWHELAEFPKAESDCNAAIRLDPDFAWVYVIRGKIFHLSNQTEAAISDLNTAIRKLNQEIDRVKQQIREADRNFDLSLAIELKDRKLADLNRKLKEAEAELVKIQADPASRTPEPQEPPAAQEKPPAAHESSDYHLKVQVSERQLQQQETIEVRVPITGTNVSFQLKPEMRNKKVRFSGFLKPNGDLFVEVCVSPNPEPVKQEENIKQTQYHQNNLFRNKRGLWGTTMLGVALVFFLLTLNTKLNSFLSNARAARSDNPSLPDHKIDCTSERNQELVNRETNRIWGLEYPGRIDKDGNAIVPIDKNREPLAAKAWAEIKSGVTSRSCK